MSSREQTSAANAANRDRSRWRLEKVTTVIRQFERDGIKFDATKIAKTAGVSRSFLYQNEDAKSLMEEAIKRQEADLQATVEARSGESLVAWRERALNAESQREKATEEILLQRSQIAELLGAIRSFEDTSPEDGVQRLVTENLSLKRRLKEAVAEADRLDARLTSARENNRFLNKRVADLEAELLDSPRPAD